MPIERIYAQLNCRDLDRSVDWFSTLFERAPDAEPMTGLREWHHADRAGMQLFENPQDAGHGCMTLIVSDLSGERQRLEGAGLKVGATEEGDAVQIVQLRDPDDNLVVLAQPKSAT